jgi:hypothetical protein
MLMNSRMTWSIVCLQPLPVPPAITLINLIASLTSLAPSLSSIGMLLFLLPALMPVSPSKCDLLSKELTSLALAPMSVLGLDTFFLPFWLHFLFFVSFF